MPDTPLGKIVSIRAETDPEIIKKFSKDQKKIHNDWIIKRNQKLKENPESYKTYWEGFQQWAKSAFSN
jgi:predicted small secreted protein